MNGQIFRNPARNEEGFVLVLSLVLLLLLTLFGVWALTSADFENLVAANAQQAERQFNVAEAANYTEAARLGYNRRTVYARISKPDVHNQLLVPDGNEFDPINGKACTKKRDGKCSADPQDPSTWPWDNLEGKTGSDRNKLLDYRYLVTYLNSDKPPAGYDASRFDSYKFRIQGNAPRTGFGMTNPGRTVETAGSKVFNRSEL